MTNTKDQQLAIDKLSRLKVGALFMEMGTGKTKTALELIASKAHKCDYVLWICPCSIKNEIRSEQEKWHPELELDIVGVESIGQSDRIYMETRSKMEGKRCFIVVDESLKIKNIRAKRTQRVLELGKLAEYKLILNGTPLSKNIMDLWTQMEFLSPKILGMTYRQFRECYAIYWQKSRHIFVIEGQTNVEHLISKIQPYIFDAELDIAPLKHYYNEYYWMSSSEEEAYANIKYQAFVEWELSDDEYMDILGLFAKLQAFYTQCEDKRESLNKLIEKIDGKVVVFVKYLASIPDDALKLTGDMTETQREEQIRLFRDGDENSVLYITYGCGAFGLNLQFCHNVIFAEHTFDYATRVQAEARVYRLGQEEDVHYYDLACDCGMEDLILKNRGHKESLLSEVKEEIEKKGAEEWLKSI